MKNRRDLHFLRILKTSHSMLLTLFAGYAAHSGAVCKFLDVPGQFIWLLLQLVQVMDDRTPELGRCNRRRSRAIVPRDKPSELWSAQHRNGGPAAARGGAMSSRRGDPSKRP